MTRDLVVLMGILIGVVGLASCGDGKQKESNGGCEQGEKFPCGPWLHDAHHHCPPGHVLVNDSSLGADHGQICIAYIDAIPDEAR